jgi:RHS repeat-associated protein
MGAFGYGYDKKDWCTYEQRDSATADGFSYDAISQVTGVAQGGTLSNGTVTGGTQMNINYDANGNRTTTSNGNVSTTYSADALKQYTAVNGAPLTYDGDANLSSYNGWTYSYDSQNRLVSGDNIATSTHLRFYYDGLNRQIMRDVTVNGVTTRLQIVYDGWQAISEYDGNNNLQACYLFGAGPDEMLARFGGVSDLVWYHRDGRGNVTRLSDSNGSWSERYVYDLEGNVTIYDPWGNLRSQPYNNNRFLFQNRDYIKEGGIYDYRNRFYSPQINRFLQPDPMGFAGDATNVYRFLENNVVNLADPTGLDAVSVGDDWYRYVVFGGVPYVAGLAQRGFHVQDGSQWLQCAGAAQCLAGGYLSDRQFYDVPNTETWFQGASLTEATEPGTVIALGWQDGGYPSEGIRDYQHDFPGSPVNHTAIFGGFDDNGNAIIYSQNPNGDIHENLISPEDQWQWNEVYVHKHDGPYSDTPSTAVVVGHDPATDEPVYEGRPIDSHSTGSNLGGWGPGGIFTAGGFAPGGFSNLSFAVGGGGRITEYLLAKVLGH